jgi:hypothetical protein
MEKMLAAIWSRVRKLHPRLSPAAKVLDLKERFRCRGCGRKGRAVVSIKWQAQSA